MAWTAVMAACTSAAVGTVRGTVVLAGAVAPLVTGVTVPVTGATDVGWLVVDGVAAGDALPATVARGAAAATEAGVTARVVGEAAGAAGDAEAGVLAEVAGVVAAGLVTT